MRIVPCMLSVWTAAAAFASAEVPHIGYCYPAGGRQGTEFVARVGGQFLEGATNAIVTGGGVEVAIEKYSVRYEPRQLQQFVRSKDNFTEELADTTDADKRERLLKQLARVKRKIAVADVPEGVDPFDMQSVRKNYRQNEKEQFNPQIAERLMVRIRILPDAAPGERELRICTPAGMSNPINFDVNLLEEVLEKEPNDDHMGSAVQEVVLPAIINGNMDPGDIDHFRFKAGMGDALVVDVGARRIIPYLADAVPGWFQAVVSIYDEEGREVAYQDDFMFNPDPVLFFDVPQNGTYTLAIRDSIYRGREDFIYRIAIGELPFITSIFPLGARQGAEVDVRLSGRNLPRNRLAGKLPADGQEVRKISVNKDGYRSNQMPFAIGTLDEVFEKEPNDDPGHAMSIQRPVVVNGRVQRVGDRDLFAFEGEKGSAVSIEVSARRLNSPLDSVITLTGPGLGQPVRNDDYVQMDSSHLYLGAGLVTHHADSYLLQELPESGTYYLEIADAQSKGGEDFGYRLRISEATPDFALRMEPSGLQIAPGGSAAFTVRATRIDGFAGEIAMEVEDLPEGFTMSKASVPAGGDAARFTITAPASIEGRLLCPKVVGVATIGGERVAHAVVPVDDQMQAFLNRHLVPAQELVLAPLEEEPLVVLAAKLPASGVVEVPLGAAVKVDFSGRLQPGVQNGKLELDAPPEGLVLEKGWFTRPKQKPEGARSQPHYGFGQISIKAGEPLKPGDTATLVVYALARERGDSEAKRCTMPAIPIKIVAPQP